MNCFQCASESNIDFNSLIKDCANDTIKGLRYFELGSLGQPNYVDWVPWIEVNYKRSLEDVS